MTFCCSLYIFVLKYQLTLFFSQPKISDIFEEMYDVQKKKKNSMFSWSGLLPQCFIPFEKSVISLISITCNYLHCTFSGSYWQSFSLLVIKGLKFNFDIGSIFERNFDPSHLQTVIIPSIVRVNDAWSSFDFSNNEPPWWRTIFFRHTSSCRLMQCFWLSSVDLKTLCKNIVA